MSTKRGGRGRPRIQRKDPPTRAPDGAQPWGKIRNPDPEMHYVCVDPGNPLQGVSFYESLGYEQTIRTDDGPSFLVGSKKGDTQISQLGQILMQIPKGDASDPQPGTKAYLDAPGQELADATEARIIDRKRGGVDNLRGINGYFGIANETDRARYEGRV